jgi:hypothetical protein
MKKVLLPVLVLFSLIIVSCYTPSSSVVSNSAQISKYKYATIKDIMDYTGSPVLMDLDVRIYDVLNDAGIKMIGEKETETISDQQLAQLLLVKYSAHQSAKESIVSISFIEYLTERPIATCRGAYGLGFSMDQDMQTALENALEQVEKLF